MKLDLTLNGRAIAFDCEPDEPLLDVLERAGVSGVRASCGAGVCGACTLLLDDEPVSACLLLAGQAANRELTSAEGVSPSHPLARALTAAPVFQCGWCRPGMLLTAKRLLEENPRPSDAEIEESLVGNLCRCGCYLSIRAAVRRAAAA